MRRFTVALGLLAVVLLAASVANAEKSGNSDVWQLMFDNVCGKAHVKTTMPYGPVRIAVNIEGLDPDTYYVVKSQKQVVGEGYPNKDGKLNLKGWIEDDQGYGRVNLRLEDDTLVAQTPVYEVD